MPRIITLTCPNCGTVVAGNVLEDHREMKCEGLECEKVLQFEDLPQQDQKHLVKNRDQYVMED
jgi:hypothetical protein